MLEALERANLFLVPLDDQRRWYRYHHLFADVLQRPPARRAPDEVAALHRRASRLVRGARRAPPAVRHALAAGDVDRAADLVELAIPALQRTRQDGTIRGWVDVIPDEVVRVRPVLGVAVRRQRSTSAGEFDDVEHRLDSIEQWLDTSTARRPRSGSLDRSDWSSPTRTQLAAARRASQLYRAALALDRGDVAASPARPAGPDRGAPGRRPHPRRRVAPCPGSRPGASGDLDGRSTRPTPRASRGCGGSGMSPTSSAARSPWPTSA